MDKSAVIIGGGLGGLFTAAILVKEGLKVSVIEKNPTCGGGLQSFTRMGEIFDTGMHVVGGMREGGNIYRLCRYLGIADKVHLRHVDEFPSDVIYIADEKKRYYTARGKEAFVDSFAKDFPDQRENLKAYVDALYAMVDELDMFYLRPAKSWITLHSDNFLISVNDFIDKYISDPKLALVLAYMTSTVMEITISIFGKAPRTRTSKLRLHLSSRNKSISAKATRVISCLTQQSRASSVSIREETTSTLFQSMTELSILISNRTQDGLTVLTFSKTELL